MKIGVMGHDLKAQTALVYNDGKGPWSTTTLDTIGLAVKNAMLIPEKTANKYLYIDSFTVSQNQVIAALEKITKKKWDVTCVDAEEQKKAGMEKVANGDFSGAMSLIRYISCIPGHGGNYIEYKESANELLSLPKETLHEVLEGILKG